MSNIKTQTATFAAGCFWGVEQTFRTLEGVLDTKVGYTGGTTQNPNYRQVCSGETKHAEAVQVVFDPQVITYDALLNHFWQCHTPTQWHRQGPDVGSQYRSAIFYHDNAQKLAAQNSKETLDKSGQYQSPIVTEIVPAETFYLAEEYHQRYFEKNGGGHCKL